LHPRSELVIGWADQKKKVAKIDRLDAESVHVGADLQVGSASASCASSRGEESAHTADAYSKRALAASTVWGVRVAHSRRTNNRSSMRGRSDDML
jgi:hypothetical protein